MSEVATWSMIRSKISSFPAPTSERGNECLTKSEITSMGGENLRINGSYGDNECVMLDDILANVITWEYTFNVSPISLSFDAVGGTKSVSVTSYKRKYINGSYTGVQEGVGYSSSVSGTGFSSQGTQISVIENVNASVRKGTATFTQYESGKTVSVELIQFAGFYTYEYVLSVSPSFLMWTHNQSGAINKKTSIVKSQKITCINGVQKFIEDSPEWSASSDMNAARNFKSTLSDYSISATPVSNNLSSMARIGKITVSLREKNVVLNLSQSGQFEPILPPIDKPLEPIL